MLLGYKSMELEFRCDESVMTNLRETVLCQSFLGSSKMYILGLVV